MYRQGDVLIKRVKGLPKDLVEIKPDKQGKTILVEGEATGHAHAFYDGTPIYEEPSTKKRFAVIEGGKTTSLLHEEHKPIHLPPGTYEIIRKKEYDWRGEERYVRD